MSLGRIFLTLFLLTVSVFAQNAPTHKKGSDALVARVSYTSTYITDSRNLDYSPKICFALYSSGYYQISRKKSFDTEILHGNVTAEQFNGFKDMLEQLDFRNNPGGVVYQGSELFIAEVGVGRETLRHEWKNQDHSSPLPQSASNIVTWLQQFEPTNASEFTLRELSDHPICPAGSIKLLEPVTAEVRFPQSSTAY